MGLCVPAVIRSLSTLAAAGDVPLCPRGCAEGSAKGSTSTPAPCSSRRFWSSSTPLSGWFLTVLRARGIWLLKEVWVATGMLGPAVMRHGIDFLRFCFLADEDKVLVLI